MVTTRFFDATRNAAIPRGRLRIVALVAALACGTALGASIAAARPAGAAPADGRSAGFSPGSTILWGTGAELAAELDAMAATGARWVRLDFDWPHIEQRQGVFTWGPTDRVVSAAQARGLSVLALPTYTPVWARPAGTSDKHPPTDPANFAAFAAAAAARYAPQGVSTWEIWNEPNIAAVWNPRPDPAAYAALLKAASAAIKAVDPAARVISGGLAPAVDAADGSQISPLSFLASIYAAGAGGAFDAVASHPYSVPARPLDPASASWNQFYKLPQLRALMVAQGDGAKQIWGTEYGVPTAGRDSVPEAEQAAFVTDAYAAFAAWPWAGPLLWYSQRDSGTDPVDREQHFGLLRKNFSPKPAAAAFAAVMGGTAPPVTAPPITAPPVTAPPVTAPPVTAPPSLAPAPATGTPAPAPANLRHRIRLLLGRLPMSSPASSWRAYTRGTSAPSHPQPVRRAGTAQAAPGRPSERYTATVAPAVAVQL